MAKSRNKQTLPQISKIAMWGPPGVGKDWLFQGFAKEVYRTQGYALRRIEGSNNRVLVEEPSPNYDRTKDDFEGDMFEFQNNNQQPASFHEFILHNGKGSAMARVLRDGAEDAPLYQSLIDSENVILVLGIPSKTEVLKRPAATASPGDPVNGPSMRTDDLSEEDSIEHPFANAARASTGGWYPTIENTEPDEGNWGINAYYEFIERFFWRIQGNPKNIAICMSKADLQQYRGMAEDIFNRKYGREFESIIQHQHQFHNIAIFCTSAFGIVRIGKQDMPNFENGKLQNPERWQPINTAAPFYWIFERIEMVRWQSIRPFFRGPKPAGYPKSFEY